jgi:predicted enzyme related to lactoylglutathione lyase
MSLQEGLPLLGLRTVIHPVDDLAAATSWWTARLGFGPYFEEPFYVGFEVAGYELGLLPGADPADGAMTYWGVTDCQAAVDAAVSLGAEVHVAPAEVGDGIVTATVRTPQGSIVGFIVNPHFTAQA